MKNVRILTETDLHQFKRHYALLRSATQEHRPDVVAFIGDFLDAGPHARGKLQVAECAGWSGGLFQPARNKHSRWFRCGRIDGRIRNGWMLDVRIPTTDKREIVLTRYTEPEWDLKLLMEKLELDLPPQPRPKIATQPKQLKANG